MLTKDQVILFWENGETSGADFRSRVYAFYRRCFEAEGPKARFDQTRYTDRINTLSAENEKLKREITRLKRAHQQELSIKYSEGYYDGITDTVNK